MKPLLIIVIFAALNRVRGGGLWGDRLPGHPRFWCAPVVFGLALWALGDWQSAAWFAAVWLAWSMQPWGDLYMLGRPAPDGQAQTELLTCALGLCVIGTMAGIALTPIMGNNVRAAPVFLGFIMVAAYEIGWQAYEAVAQRTEVRPVPFAHTIVAEPLVGAAWGLILIICRSAS